MIKYFAAVIVLAAALGSRFVLDLEPVTKADPPVGPPPIPSIFATGRIEGASPTVEIRPRGSGRINQVLVKEGDHVESGQVLLRFDGTHLEHELALSEAQLELERGQLERLRDGPRAEERNEAAALLQAEEAVLERLQLQWRRAERLRASAAISQQQVDEDRTQLAAAQAKVAAAKARFDLLNGPAREDEVRIAEARIAAAAAKRDMARVQLDRMQLRAPFAGCILRINVDSGELAGPDAVDPVVVMADTRRFRVRAYIEELDAPRVALGLAATITADGLPGVSLSGRVVGVSPYMTEKHLWTDAPNERKDTKVREVWLDLDTADTMVVGLRVDVMIDPGKPAAASDPATPRDVAPGDLVPGEIAPESTATSGLGR